jgi:hypothetical protein
MLWRNALCHPNGSCEVTLMCRISLFTEDTGHEEFLLPLLQRIADQYRVSIVLKPLSVRGGYGKVAEELEEYVHEIVEYRESMPDLLLVATDANCQGFIERRKQLQKTVELIRDQVVFAVPDPHVERWLLLDSAAFKTVLGKPCKAPDQKCDRDRYKSLLAQAVRQCGITPYLGGVEYARDIVMAMDLQHVQDRSLAGLLEELNTRFRSWRNL